MKFVPRQPQPPPPRPNSRTTTTRFLRLQPAEDVGDESVRTEPRPLPAFPERPVRDTGRTASQRVRLRLDPAVASQPLPHAGQLLREPVSRAGCEEPPAVEVLDSPLKEESGATLAEPTEAFLDETPVAETVAGESGLIAEEAAESTPEIFEIPAEPETVREVWVPPGPGAGSPSTWLPPVAPRPFTMADIPRPASLAALSGLESAAQAEAESSAPRRPKRPELRRPTTPLAQLAKAEQSSLGRGFWILLGGLALILLVVLYFFGIEPRLAAYQAAHLQAAPVLPPQAVTFAVARRGSPVTELPVSGTVEPSRETSIYARTTGYVKSWSADLGDKVQEGQILAELDTPEVDHQLTEARAAADQAKAQVELAQNESDRWAKMAGEHSVAQVDADAKVAALNAAQANFNAAEANVGRLADLEMFKQIRAPYAGTITARNLEVGTLVGAGPTGSELFRVTQTDPIRVFVNVPETSAPVIHAGIAAKVQVTAYPGREFAGEIVRDAGALDAATHTLRTEVHVGNPDGALLSGTMASVRLQLVDPTPALLVPTSAIIMSRAGASIARVVPSDGREVVQLTPVKIGRTFGAEVELLGDPVQVGDRVVTDPPDDLRDGMVVNARPFEAPSAVPALLAPHPAAPRA